MRTLQEQFSAYPFQVLGFPCNQFGAQEPGSDQEILEFAQTKYDANFQLFSKIEVNGPGTCNLYKILKNATGGEDIGWNFAKFLVDRDGKVVQRFSPQTTPEELTQVIHDQLGL